MQNKVVRCLMTGLGCTLIAALGSYSIAEQSVNLRKAKMPSSSPAKKLEAPKRAKSAATALSTERLTRIVTSERITKGLKNFLSTIFLGITSRGEAVYVLDKVETGKFFWFDITSGKLRRTLDSSSFEFNECRLSHDGERVFVAENINSLPRGDYYANKLLVLNSKNMTVIKTIINKSKVGIFYPSLVGEATDKVAFPILESTWDAKLKDYAGDPERGARIEIWDWTTSRQLRAIPYPHAPGIADMAFSPDGKYIACFFKNRLKNRFNDIGILDILDSKTGKVLWHIEGNKDQPVSFPFVFLSSTQLVCPNVIYDLANKTVKPLFAVGDRRLKFVGGVPGHRGKLLILAKSGLELWDWPAQHTLRRWPQVTKADQVTFAPDLKAMAVEVADKNLFQFWKFDPAWLK